VLAGRQWDLHSGARRHYDRPQPRGRGWAFWREGQWMETRGLNARAHVRVDSKSEEFAALADYREKV